jgi:hypothetical protein
MSEVETTMAPPAPPIAPSAKVRKQEEKPVRLILETTWRLPCPDTGVIFEPNLPVEVAHITPWMQAQIDARLLRVYE